MIRPTLFRAEDSPSVRRVRFGLSAGLGLLLWTALYKAIEPASEWIVFSLLGLSPDSREGGALQFFLYNSAKILLLLVVMVYTIAFIRAGLNVERVRGLLAGRSRVLGYALGSIFGAVTPFCSCSSVPLFIGFTAGGIPLGITMAFLITSPVINEVAVVLLWELLGWKLACVYIAAGLAVGMAGGAFIDLIGARRWLQPFLLQALASGVPATTGHAAASTALTLETRHAFAKAETRDILRRVWRWVFAGVAVGALIHGWVPEDWILANLTPDNLWSVPAAVVLGLPIYTNVTGIVPVMENLLLKGLPLGTTLAFSISSVAASLPEVMMLKQVMRAPLIAAFLGFLLAMLTVLSLLLNQLS